jgi:hypothetical protein
VNLFVGAIIHKMFVTVKEDTISFEAAKVNELISWQILSVLFSDSEQFLVRGR